jgi:hypothetical protein
MSYAVRAWREKNGDHGISIGTVAPVGWDNHVAEIILIGSEAQKFIAECQEALERAKSFSEPQEDKMPGPYTTEGWKDY